MGDEETNFEAMVRFVFFAHKVAIFEEPSLGLCGNQFPIQVTLVMCGLGLEALSRPKPALGS